MPAEDFLEEGLALEEECLALALPLTVDLFLAGMVVIMVEGGMVVEWERKEREELLGGY